MCVGEEGGGGAYHSVGLNPVDENGDGSDTLAFHGPYQVSDVRLCRNHMLPAGHTAATLGKHDTTIALQQI